MKDSHLRMLSTLAAVAAAAGLSFVLGRWSSDEPRPAAATLAATAAAPIRETPRASRAFDLPPPARAERAAGRAAQRALEADHDLDHLATVAPPPAPEGPVKDPKAAVKGALDAVGQAMAAPSDHHIAEAAQAAAGVLETLMQRDAGVLAEAVRRFAEVDDPLQLDVLATLLGRVQDPVVEALALRLSLEDPRPRHRAAALQVLDGLDTPLARPIALAALRREVDQDVRRAALHALPPARGASAEEAADVVASLVQVLEGDADAEARRRAALRLAEWHREPGDLAPVQAHLLRDPSVDVRAGCAFALELAGRRLPELQRALAGALKNPKEDPFVRETAWRALGALSPLPPDVQDVYRLAQLAREAGS